MLDLKFVLSQFDLVQANLASQGVDPSSLQSLVKMDVDRREVIQKVENLKAEKNQISQEISKLLKDKKDASEVIQQTKEMTAEIKKLDQELSGIEEKLNLYISSIPNLVHESVPIGKGEEGNIEVRKEGTFAHPKFKMKDHVELGEGLGILNFEEASILSGSRFSVMKGLGARLERALAQFMLDLQTEEHGYCEFHTPFLVNAKTLYGTGQLPKFREDLFKIEDRDLFLIPTAEVTLTNLNSGQILKEEELPMKSTAYTPCFRSEAGSYGKDTRGLIRQHQFTKVELVRYEHPERSYEALEEMLGHAEEVLKRLEIPYRVMSLCTGDIGFSSAKTYDIEVWLPGQEEGKGKFREISSCSNCTDFQARRSGIRFKPKAGGKPQFVHTLNGSGLAVGRTWIAVVENYQQEDGSIRIPKALFPYMGGVTEIK